MALNRRPLASWSSSSSSVKRNRALGLPGGHNEEFVSSYLQKGQSNTWHTGLRNTPEIFEERRKGKEFKWGNHKSLQGVEGLWKSRVSWFLCEQTPEVCPGQGRQKSLGTLWHSGRLWKGAYKSIPWSMIQLEVITHCGPVYLLGACLVPTSKQREPSWHHQFGEAEWLVQIVPSHAESCLVTPENGWPSPIGLSAFAARFETGTFTMSPQNEAVLPRLTGLFKLRAIDCHVALSLPMKMYVWLTEAVISDMSPPA